MNQHRLEILAPAGDFERMRAAVFSGADCVYVGVEGFNARRAAGNFSPEELVRAVGFCHARNCKVYAALNVVVLPGQEDALDAAVLAVRNAGCDGVIVQDLQAARRVRELAPELPLHASTQMSVHSSAGVRQLAQMGFSRAILARELCCEEIAEIAKNSPIELEVFVHGALCVGVSGQCYMSAFFGGRSANRGGCAAPCRLPFRAEGCVPPEELLGGEKTPTAVGRRELSLKDLSILDALPQLQEMGIACGKIEGRLRTPEYVAVAVDCACKARDGRPYDRELLRRTFSRSGFTDGWFSGQNGAEMFGLRTEQDEAASKQALAAAHELYRREAPRVPVKMELRAGPEGACLAVRDGRVVVEKQLPGPLPPAEKETEPALRAVLRKTGGTPFYAAEEDVQVEAGGVFLSAPALGAARRQALEELLALREGPVRDEAIDAQVAGKEPEPAEREVPETAEEVGAKAVPPQEGEAKDIGNKQAIAAAQEVLESAGAASGAGRREAGERPVLRARFETMGQVLDDIFKRCSEILVPMAEAERVPEEYREKCWLCLPRVAFGADEQRMAQRIEKTRGMGFSGYEVQNIAQLQLCSGLPMAAGFGLNCTNAGTARQLAERGCSRVTLSPEMSLRQMRDVVEDVRVPQGVWFDMVCYGHFPLMMTRACPLKQVTGCSACTRCGRLRDRKGQAFPVVCQGEVRTLYNPVPLWMADRLCEVPTDSATVYFTLESKAQAGTVLAAFVKEQAAEAEFTRGLYYKGTEG